jgi:hypothetical protein
VPWRQAWYRNSLAEQIAPAQGMHACTSVPFPSLGTPHIDKAENSIGWQQYILGTVAINHVPPVVS